MSNSKHTPGPWRPMKNGTLGPWVVYRDLIGSGGYVEPMKNPDGTTAAFESKEQALAAIARATGSAS